MGLGTTGRADMFVLAAAMYAVGTAIIGASPAAYAADVMPKESAGLGLGIYRCAGDLGTLASSAVETANNKSARPPASSL